MTDALEDDGFTEVKKANIHRVDLVDHSANGTPFLIMKSAENPNLLSTEFVQELISKAEEPNMTAPKPGEWIKKAEVEPVIDEPLIEPSGAAGAAAAVVASPEWEQVDADTAVNDYALLQRVSNSLELLTEREAIEGASADGDFSDNDNVYALEDAASAVGYAMDTLAVYAASEQTNADVVEKATSPAFQIMKAVAGFDRDALATVESFGSIRKAGRTLSAANETKLRSASDQITSVLASLPVAPDEVTKEAAPVAEATPAVEAVITKSEPIVTEPVTEAVVKADADASAAAGLQAVFDAAGKLVGVVDPSAIQAVSGASASDAPTDEPAPAADPDAAPAPAAVGEPTDEVAKSTNVEDIVKSAVDEVRAEQAELVKGLRADIDFLKAPAAPRAFTNGADGTVPVDRSGAVLKGAVDGIDQLVKASHDATNATELDRANNARRRSAIEILSAGPQNPSTF
jgi:hypothetical protein